MEKRLATPRKHGLALVSITSVISAVEAARTAAFPPDPLLDDDLSRIISTVTSVAKRHGPLLENAVCDALLASGRYDCERHVRLPITRASRDPHSEGDLELDDDIVGDVEVDLLVYDRVDQRLLALQIKRGNGKTDARKRRQIEHDLRAAARVLRSFARKRGYEVVTVAVHVVDIYGAAGFSADLTIRGSDLDRIFGVPVALSIEVTTAALRTTISAMLPSLLAPIVASAGRSA